MANQRNRPTKNPTGPQSSRGRRHRGAHGTTRHAATHDHFVRTLDRTQRDTCLRIPQASSRPTPNLHPTARAETMPPANHAQAGRRGATPLGCVGGAGVASGYPARAIKNSSALVYAVATGLVLGLQLGAVTLALGAVRFAGGFCDDEHGLYLSYRGEYREEAARIPSISRIARVAKRSEGNAGTSPPAVGRAHEGGGRP